MVRKAGNAGEQDESREQIYDESREQIRALSKWKSGKRRTRERRWKRAGKLCIVGKLCLGSKCGAKHRDAGIIPHRQLNWKSHLHLRVRIRTHCVQIIIIRNDRDQAMVCSVFCALPRALSRSSNLFHTLSTSYTLSICLFLRLLHFFGIS